MDRQTKRKIKEEVKNNWWKFLISGFFYIIFLLGSVFWTFGIVRLLLELLVVYKIPLITGLPFVSAGGVFMIYIFLRVILWGIKKADFWTWKTILAINNILIERRIRKK